jgi:predicted amidohydrolase
MLVVMANHAASVGTYTSVGRSALWSPDGDLLAQAAGAESTLLIATSHEGLWRGEVTRI